MSSTVYESHPRLEGIGGGFTIAPNGMNVLEEIGIAGSIANCGTAVSEFCFRNHRGKVLARCRAGHVARYRWPSIATLRTTLHQVLLEEVARQGIRVEYRKRLKEPGHPQVENQDVGFQSFRQTNRFQTVSRHARDGKIRLAV